MTPASDGRTVDVSAILDGGRLQLRFATMLARSANLTQRQEYASDGPLSRDRVEDGAVRGAKDGPSVEALEQMVAGRPCDLGNIEVFYRLGLAALALAVQTYHMQLFGMSPFIAAAQQHAFRVPPPAPHERIAPHRRAANIDRAFGQCGTTIAATTDPVRSCDH